MSQQQLQTAVSARGKRITGLTGTPTEGNAGKIDLLDNALPLQSGSHADVVEYRVEAPMRYAECLALLADGRKVGLRNPCQFVGWSGKSLLFSDNGRYLEVAIENDSHGHGARCTRVIFLEDASERRKNFARKYIGIDGNLVNLTASAGTA